MSSSTLSSRTSAKVQKVFGLTSGKREKFGLEQEKSIKVKKVTKYLELIERFHIFAPSKFLFDYAAECGEQGFIDTAPFKSHLMVAFIFHIFFGTIYYTWVIEYGL